MHSNAFLSCIFISTWNCCIFDRYILLGIHVDNVLANFIILIYKYSLYKHREKEILPSVELFKNMIHNYERIERIIAGSRNKIEIHRKKWRNLSRQWLKYFRILNGYKFEESFMLCVLSLSIYIVQYSLCSLIRIFVSNYFFFLNIYFFFVVTL